jgi:hypothetical protein
MPRGVSGCGVWAFVTQAAIAASGSEPTNVRDALYFGLGGFAGERVVEGQKEVLALADALNLRVVQAAQRVGNGLTLSIKHRGLQRDVNMSAHGWIIAFAVEAGVAHTWIRRHDSLGTHDVGSNRRLRLDGCEYTHAIFGGAQKEYRYTLERRWGSAPGTVLFVMMNPSVADEDCDDATVAKCGRYIRAWGYERLLVGNTFAYRATHQKRLMEVSDPVGPDNDKHLVAMARQADRIVFAYGMPHASLRSRGPEVVKLLEADGHGKKIHALKLCADGTPSHPLYLKGDLMGFRWKR